MILTNLLEDYLEFRELEENPFSTNINDYVGINKEDLLYRDFSSALNLASLEKIDDSLDGIFDNIFFNLGIDESEIKHFQEYLEKNYSEESIMNMFKSAGKIYPSLRKKLAEKFTKKTSNAVQKLDPKKVAQVVGKKKPPYIEMTIKTNLPVGKIFLGSILAYFGLRYLVNEYMKIPFNKNTKVNYSYENISEIIRLKSETYDFLEYVINKNNSFDSVLIKAKEFGFKITDSKKGDYHVIFSKQLVSPQATKSAFKYGWNKDKLNKFRDSLVNVLDRKTLEKTQNFIELSETNDDKFRCEMIESVLKYNTNLGKVLRRTLKSFIDASKNVNDEEISKENLNMSEENFVASNHRLVENYNQKVNSSLQKTIWKSKFFNISKKNIFDNMPSGFQKSNFFKSQMKELKKTYSSFTSEFFFAATVIFIFYLLLCVVTVGSGYPIPHNRCKYSRRQMENILNEYEKTYEVMKMVLDLSLESIPVRDSFIEIYERSGKLDFDIHPNIETPEVGETFESLGWNEKSFYDVAMDFQNMYQIYLSVLERVNEMPLETEFDLLKMKVLRELNKHSQYLEENVADFILSGLGENIQNHYNNSKAIEIKEISTENFSRLARAGAIVGKKAFRLWEKTLTTKRKAEVLQRASLFYQNTTGFLIKHRPKIAAKISKEDWHKLGEKMIVLAKLEKFIKDGIIVSTCASTLAITYKLIKDIREFKVIAPGALSTFELAYVKSCLLEFELCLDEIKFLVKKPSEYETSIRRLRELGFTSIDSPEKKHTYVEKIPRKSKPSLAESYGWTNEEVKKLLSSIEKLNHEEIIRDSYVFIDKAETELDGIVSEIIIDLNSHASICQSIILTAINELKVK